MPIVVQCMHCGQQGEVSRSAGGCDVMCATCGQTFNVPIGMGHVTVEWGIDVAGTRVPIRPGRELRIGRAPENDLILGGERVSRQHAVVRWADDEWHIDDLGSSNGLAVDGQRVRTAVLKTGAKFTIGDCVLRITLASAARRAGPSAIDELAAHESHDSVPGTLRPLHAPPARPRPTHDSSADTFAGERVAPPPGGPDADAANGALLPRAPAAPRRPSWVLFALMGAVFCAIILVAWWFLL